MNLLFLHGAGCTGRVFDAQLAAFAGAAAPTLPGHDGDAPAPFGIEAFADAVARRLDAAGSSETIVCGSSMGGAIALELGLRGDPRIRGIVLIGSGARLRVAPALFESLEEDFPAGARALAENFFAGPAPERVDAVVEMMLEVGPAQTIADFHACDRFDATERLAALPVPLLAIAGASDVLTPPKFAQFLADRVPGAAARILPGAGHLAMVECPDATNALLRSFVARLENR